LVLLREFFASEAAKPSALSDSYNFAIGLRAQDVFKTISFLLMRRIKQKSQPSGWDYFIYLIVRKQNYSKHILEQSPSFSSPSPYHQTASI
jgi:hypothetical protein